LLVGFARNLRPLLALKALLATMLVATALALQPAPDARAEGCAFPFTPTTYEGMRDRQLYLDTIELAGNNMLFPGDPFFGLPNLEVGNRRSARTHEPHSVPPVLLKSIAYIESAINQAAATVPYGSIGPALISFDCGHGIAQVTTGMTLPTGEAGRGSPEQALVATHFAYNIARGAVILAEKWNGAPEARPIVGSGHPSIIENWYFALWSYNGFTGPGANRSNHPLDPVYGSWPRTPYSCGPASDGLGHNRANYPYQELVIGCATNPPVVEGAPLWESQDITLPNLRRRSVSSALALVNFVFPYQRMDIATPRPYHLDLTPRPPEGLRDTIIGQPEIAVSDATLEVDMNGTEPVTQVVDIFNAGTGVLVWYAVPSAPWLTALPYTGIAVGLDYECNADVPCDRQGHMEVTVDRNLVPPDVTEGQIVIEVLGTDMRQVVTVRLERTVPLGAREVGN
jgi:hypothetical protein